MLAPTLVLGALFPLLASMIIGPERGMSDAVGDVYFINTLGSAAGALAAGFILIPAIGLRHTLGLTIALDLVTAAGILLWQQQWRGGARIAAATSMLVAGLAISMWPPSLNEEGLTRGVYRRAGREVDSDLSSVPLIGMPEQEIVFYRDGINTSVSVHRTEGRLSLRVNGKVDAGSTGDMPTQVLLGEIPMLFGPRAEHVLVIGLGSGVTAGSVALHDSVQVDVVELEPAIVEASHFFDEYNHRPLDRPNVHVIADDARAYLSYTRERYDVIISEPSNPWITGAASLFTREFFQTAHRALRPAGRFCQWLQLYEIDPDAVRAVLAAFRAEFPVVYGFSSRAGSEDFFLLGMDQPLPQGAVPLWHTLPNAVRDDLRRANTYSSPDLWSLMQLRPAEIDEMVRHIDVANTDDRMHVELRLPWMLSQPSLKDDNWAYLDPFRHGIEAPADPEALGAIALAYADVRTDPQLGREFLSASQRLGLSAHAAVAEAVLLRQDKPDALSDILALLDTAVGRGPQFYAPWYHRARVRQVANQIAEALGDVNVALQIWPGDWNARHLRVRLLALLERPAEAHAEAESLLATPYAQIEPALWGDAALQSSRTGDLDAAIAEMHRYLQAFPNSDSEWSALAGWYEKRGEHDKARDAQTNAQRSRHNRAVSIHHIARRRQRAGRTDDAIATLRNALAIDPTYEPAQQELERLVVARYGPLAVAPPSAQPAQPMHSPVEPEDRE
jgi:spermidine synthase/tetratricopeptide (TPR) repeat protein